MPGIPPRRLKSALPTRACLIRREFRHVAQPGNMPHPILSTRSHHCVRPRKIGADQPRKRLPVTAGFGLPQRSAQVVKPSESGRQAAVRCATLVWSAFRGQRELTSGISSMRRQNFRSRTSAGWLACRLAGKTKQVVSEHAAQVAQGCGCLSLCQCAAAIPCSRCIQFDGRTLRFPGPNATNNSSSVIVCYLASSGHALTTWRIAIPVPPMYSASNQHLAVGPVGCLGNPCTITRNIAMPLRSSGANGNATRFARQPPRESACRLRRVAPPIAEPSGRMSGNAVRQVRGPRAGACCPMETVNIHA